MRCNNCGNEIPNGSSQCPICGAQVAQPNGFGQTSESEFNNQFGYSNNQGQNQGWGNPQNQGFGQWGGQQGFSGGNIQSPRNAPEFVLFLIIGIAYTICCCCSSLPIAIPGLIFTFLMNSRYKEGNMRAYNSNKKVAKWIYIIGVILWIIGAIIGIATGMFDRFTWRITF